MAAVQYQRNLDPVISKLIDPSRGYFYTCNHCQKHLKEDALSSHLCEREKITLDQVDFIRDKSMRYRCGVCNLAVPIVLVRAHVARHIGEAIPDKPTPSTVEPVPCSATPDTQPAPNPPTLSTSDSGVSTKVEEVRSATGVKRRTGQASVMDCIRKIRKVELTMDRVEMVAKRVLFVARKRALRRWGKNGGTR